MDLKSGGGEHDQRRLDRLRLEVAVKRIGKQYDLGCARAPNRSIRFAKDVGAPARLSWYR